MKKLILLTLLALMTLCNAEELKVTTTKLAQGTSCYGSEMFECLSTTVWCINGYKWLQTGTGNSTSISQMFQNERINWHAQAIPCKN